MDGRESVCRVEPGLTGQSEEGTYEIQQNMDCPLAVFLLPGASHVDTLDWASTSNPPEEVLARLRWIKRNRTS